MSADEVFDEAIQAIRFYIAEEPELDRDRKNRAKVKLQRLDKLEAAIRWLEVAGKVDKAKLMVYLNHAIDWKEKDPYGPGSAGEDRIIRALLESLPDGGKEKEA